MIPFLMDDNVFFSYLFCKYKGYLKFKGEKGELSEYGILKTNLLQDYKNAVISTIICRDKLSLVPQNSPLTISDLKRGDPFIVNATIKYESIICRFDALKRLDGNLPWVHFTMYRLFLAKTISSGAK